jgi:hypothetical protein
MPLSDAFCLPIPLSGNITYNELPNIILEQRKEMFNAAGRGDPSAVEALLAEGAEIKAKSAFGRTALEISSGASTTVTMSYCPCVQNSSFAFAPNVAAICLKASARFGESLALRIP